MKTAMRRSRVLEKLRNGEVAICTKLNLADARVAEIAAIAGFDCIWTDMEHVANDWSVIEKQILAAKIYDVDIVVRVDRGSYSSYIKPLELDASGIMIPHVIRTEEAKSIIRNTKFHPLGLRPLDGGNADGLFARLDLHDYLHQANAQRFNMMQIEDPEALQNLDDILALPGLDMIFFGPGDFSQAIGEPGNFSHPRVQEARRLIAERAAAHGKYAGTVGNLDNFQELVELGYKFISIGADVIGLSSYFGKLQADLSGKLKPLTESLYGE